MLNINYAQAVAILDAFGGDEDTVVTISKTDDQGDRGHSGPGLYLHYEACRDEGSIFLGPEADA